MHSQSSLLLSPDPILLAGGHHNHGQPTLAVSQRIINQLRDFLGLEPQDWNGFKWSQLLYWSSGKDPRQVCQVDSLECWCVGRGLLTDWEERERGERPGRKKMIHQSQTNNTSARELHYNSAGPRSQFRNTLSCPVRWTGLLHCVTFISCWCRCYRNMDFSTHFNCPEHQFSFLD